MLSDMIPDGISFMNLFGKTEPSSTIDTEVYAFDRIDHEDDLKVTTTTEKPSDFRPSPRTFPKTHRVDPNEFQPILPNDPDFFKLRPIPPESDYSTVLLQDQQDHYYPDYGITTEINEVQTDIPFDPRYQTLYKRKKRQGSYPIASL